MRLLFSSPRIELIEEMGQKLSESGINCEIRYRPPGPENAAGPGYRELWVQTDRELQWAAALLALHCEVGRN